MKELPQPEMTQHLNKKNPDSIRFENDWVKVTEVKMKPGEQLPKHLGATRAIISLSDYQMLYNSDVIKNLKSKFDNESVHLHQADNHTLKNIGTTDAHFLTVQFKK